MSSTSFGFDSALEKLTNKFNHPHMPKWAPIVADLEFLKTFLTFVPKWSDRDEVVRTHLGDFLNNIKDAFGEANRHIEAGKFQENIEIFALRIREIYEFLSDYSFRANNSPITDPQVWLQLCDCLHTNANRLYSEKHLDYSLYIELTHTLHHLRFFVYDYIELSNRRKKIWDLRTHLGAVGICLAGLLFSWWIGKSDENMLIESSSMNNMLYVLLQKIKPNTPNLLEMYFKAMKSEPSSTAERVRTLAEKILLPSPESHETLRDGLVFLIRHLVESPDKDAEVVMERSDIEKVIFDAASRDYFPSNDQDDEKILLFGLLQKIELLKVEIVIMKTSGGESINKGTFESIYKGLRFLQAFLESIPHDKNSEKFMVIFKRIEDLAREAESLQRSQKGRRPGDAIKFKLLLVFKITKICAFLMEVMGCCSNPSLMVVLKDGIDSMDEGLELINKHFSMIAFENIQSDLEDILTCLEGVIEAAKPLNCFLDSNQFAENSADEMSLLPSNLQEKLCLLNKQIKLKVAYFQFPSSLDLPLPKTHQGLGFVDFFLENLSELIKNKAGSIGYLLMQRMQEVLKEFTSLRSLVGEKKTEHPEIKNLRGRVTRAAYEADFVIDWTLLVNGVDFFHVRRLSNVIEEVKAIQENLIKMNEMKSESAEIQGPVQTADHMKTLTGTPEAREVVVALEDQEEIIVDRLTRGSPKRQVVTLVGMPGIGKTTLAQKVFDNPLVKNHFHSHAWCCISQVYWKREVLVKILSDLSKTNDDFHEKNDQDLDEMLYKRLKGRRYFVVLDDLWSTQAWDELGIAFPDDSNGSRILFTSRYDNVASEDQHPHSLRFLTEGESWKMLNKKVFPEDGCPEELTEVGRMIAKSCKGLPLAIVAISGLLKRTEKSVDLWKKIEQDLNSRILADPESQCNRILELSYNHLPDDLKPCFLYLAAFSENEVPVQKLIRLWIAEGFISRFDRHQNTSLEDIAENYLADLISRSLLMSARRGSNSRVKSCKIHDVLREFCLTKAAEENFFESITGYDELFPSSTSRSDYGIDIDYPLDPIHYKQHRLSICSKRKHFVMLKPSGLPVRTLLFFASSDSYPRCPYDVSFIPHKFKILRVLDVESINMGSSFPRGLESMDRLRYLAISGDVDSVPSTIAKLWNLETFVVRGLRGKVTLPDSIWEMSRLRHLNVIDNVVFSLKDESVASPSSPRLDNLTTLSTPVFPSGENSDEIIKKFPNLRKLRCTFSEQAHHDSDGKCIRFPDLKFLRELESLKIFYYGTSHHSCTTLTFPLNLKKLSLADFSLKWDCISAIGALPRLEVLKLVSVAFESSIWEMKEGEFRELTFLKLESLEIVEWNASSDHLPSLQQLVLRGCKRLEQVPPGFGEMATLEMIEVMWCNRSLDDSVRSIEEEQMEYGNKEFKVFVNLPRAFR